MDILLAVLIVAPFLYILFHIYSRIFLVGLLIQYLNIDLLDVGKAVSDGVDDLKSILLEKLIEKHKLLYYRKIQILSGFFELGVITSQQIDNHRANLLRLISSCSVQGHNYCISPAYDIDEVESTDEKAILLNKKWNRAFVASAFNWLVLVKIMPFIFRDIRVIIGK